MPRRLLAGFEISGNELGNTIHGGAANDLLRGFGGNDTLVGFAGNDRYQIDDAGDVVVEAENGGIDTINTTISYQLVEGGNVENLDGLGSTGLTLVGNSMDNLIDGTPAAISCSAAAATTCCGVASAMIASMVGTATILCRAMTIRSEMTIPISWSAVSAMTFTMSAAAILSSRISTKRASSPASAIASTSAAATPSLRTNISKFWMRRVMCRPL